MFEGVEITATGELKCTDKAVLERTKGILSDLVTKVLKNIV